MVRISSFNGALDKGKGRSDTAVHQESQSKPWLLLLIIFGFWFSLLLWSAVADSDLSSGGRTQRLASTGTGRSSWFNLDAGFLLIGKMRYLRFSGKAESTWKPIREEAREVVIAPVPDILYLPVINVVSFGLLAPSIVIFLSYHPSQWRSELRFVCLGLVVSVANGRPVSKSRKGIGSIGRLIKEDLGRSPFGTISSVSGLRNRVMEKLRIQR